VCPFKRTSDYVAVTEVATGTHDRPSPLGSNKMENRQHRSGNFPRQLSAEWTERMDFPSPKLLQHQRANGFWGFECIMNMPECAKWTPAPPERGLCPGEVEYPTSFHMQSWVVAV